LYCGFFKSPMQRHHCPAHVVFADISRPIVGILGAYAAYNLVRNQTAFEFPVEETLACIARPQGAVAVKNRERGLSSENGFNKFGSLCGWRCSHDLQGALSIGHFG
jgi:hypothetical protein